MKSWEAAMPRMHTGAACWLSSCWDKTVRQAQPDIRQLPSSNCPHCTLGLAQVLLDSETRGHDGLKQSVQVMRRRLSSIIGHFSFICTIHPDAPDNHALVTAEVRLSGAAHRWDRVLRCRSQS